MHDDAFCLLSGSSAVLIDNEEKYLMAPCHPNAVVPSGQNEDSCAFWFVVQLSEDIIIGKCTATASGLCVFAHIHCGLRVYIWHTPISLDSFLLSNLEHFSSAIKSFAVYGSDRGTPLPSGRGSGMIPPDAHALSTTAAARWIPLGTFLAHNTASMSDAQQQLFILAPEDRSAVRFLWFRFFTHYGDQHWITLTSLRVFGRTVMESLRDEEEQTRSGSQSASLANASSSTAVLSTRHDVEPDARSPAVSRAISSLPSVSSLPASTEILDDDTDDLELDELNVTELYVFIHVLCCVSAAGRQLSSNLCADIL